MTPEVCAQHNCAVIQSQLIVPVDTGQGQTVWINNGGQRVQPSPRTQPRDGESTRPLLGPFGVGVLRYLSKGSALANLAAYHTCTSLKLQFKTLPHFL